MDTSYIAINQISTQDTAVVAINANMVTGIAVGEALVEVLANDVEFFVSVQVVE